MMGLTAFIPSNWKVVTIEDTPELTLPHNNWITEATRNTGNAASSVTMDLPATTSMTQSLKALQLVHLTFQGHARSTKRSPSCSPYTICYKCPIVTMDLTNNVYYAREL